MMMRAALSASMRNGIGHVLRSVMRERTNPGQMTDTQMRSLFSMALRDSPHVFTHALVAE